MRRLLLLSSLFYGLFFLGLLLLRGELLVLAVPLLVYLVAVLFYGPQPLQLEASRTIDADRISQGASVLVRLSIRNAGSNLEQVLIKDCLPLRLELISGASHLLTALPAGETVALEYILKGNRGNLDLDEVQITASDRLGLFSRQVTLSAPAQVVVLPQILRLPRIGIRPFRTRAYAGPIPARQGGSGIQFFGVREYQLGDPLRWINWRVSARHQGNLFTNEFEQERIADVGLILDARQVNEVQLAGDSFFEHSVRATASLAAAFLADGNRVGLLIYGQFLDWTFPGYGRVQRERLMRALARARTGQSMVFDSLDYLPTRFFPAQSQLVIVSPLGREDVPSLVRLRARGYQVLVISADLVSFEARALEPHATTDLAVRLARVERVLLLRKLGQAGIQVVDWQVEKRLDQVLRASLGRAPPWYRAVGVAS